MESTLRVDRVRTIEGSGEGLRFVCEVSSGHLTVRDVPVFFGPPRTGGANAWRVGSATRQYVRDGETRRAIVATVTERGASFILSELRELGYIGGGDE